MAQWIPVGEPVNDAERRVMAALRDRLPADYAVISNFELIDGEKRPEIHLAILAPHSVYLVDVKGTQGRIEVYGSRWYPEGRDGYLSPLAKLNHHAKILKEALKVAHGSAMRDLHVQGAVVLSEANARLLDPDGRDAPFTRRLEDAAAFFTDASLVPSHRSDNIARLLPDIQKTLGALPKRRERRYGYWLVTESLGGDERTEELAVRHTRVGHGAVTARLRLFRFDPLLPKPEREAQRTKILNGYNVLSRVPGHEAIVGVRDLIEPEDEPGTLGYVLDEPRARSLHAVLGDSETLTFDRKLRCLRDLLGAPECANKIGQIPHLFHLQHTTSAAPRSPHQVTIMPGSVHNPKGFSSTISAPRRRRPNTAYSRRFHPIEMWTLAENFPR